LAKRILIVDDESHIRLLLHRTLEELELEGVEIHFAEDGLQALAKARDLKPDLILLDVMMPGMDGMDVCAAVRKDPKLAGVHVIILTAKGQSHANDAETGPHEYLTKPFDPDEIVMRAAEVLGIDIDIDFEF
jgi:CheY-like chemotaxis protein